VNFYDKIVFWYGDITQTYLGDPKTTKPIESFNYTVLLDSGIVIRFGKNFRIKDCGKPENRYYLQVLHGFVDRVIT